MKKKQMIFSPSILGADFANLDAAVKLIKRVNADWLHLDIMDGHFVPPISFGAELVKTLRPLSNIPFDVHLMVDRPELHINDFIAAGANHITFHIEATKHPHRLMRTIQDSGCKAGISLVPSTPVQLLAEILREIDLVLVMSVNPGYGEQPLLPFCLNKVKALAKECKKEGYGYDISIDGGINLETAVAAWQAGANVLVSGSSFFKSADPLNYVKTLRSSCINPTTHQGSSSP